jgi:maleate isomerase
MTRLGVVLPSSNTTVEPEFREMLPDDCTVHAARVPLENVTADELDVMADHAERAASLLSHASVDGVAYACTTGSLIHGAGFDTRLESRLSDAVDAPAIATARSVVRALNTLDGDEVAVATPYSAELDRLERDYLTENDIEVVSIDGRGLVENAAIGKLDAVDAEEQGGSILSTTPEADTLFISCTNYRSIPALMSLEAEFGIPVISSNAATAWDLCNQVGIQLDLNTKLIDAE